MKKHKFTVLTFLLLIPIFSIGQIPKGHFLDADDSAESGYKVKPFIQKKEGIYHYAILTELPFENDCASGLSEKKQIKCSEMKLKALISRNFTQEMELTGKVYVYLTVTENAQIEDIKVESYPQSNLIDDLIKKATEKIKVRPGKYNGKTVRSRLWTSFQFK